MEKVIREGKVAVIYSRGFCLGWYSWNDSRKELLFHPKLVEIIESKNHKIITKEWLSDNLGIDNVYCGGANSLTIKWLDEGSVFKICERDGNESIIVVDSDYITA